MSNQLYLLKVLFFRTGWNTNTFFITTKQAILNFTKPMITLHYKTLKMGGKKSLTKLREYLLLNLPVPMDNFQLSRHSEIYYSLLHISVGHFYFIPRIICLKTIVNLHKETSLFLNSNSIECSYNFQTLQKAKNALINSRHISPLVYDSKEIAIDVQLFKIIFK